MKLALIIAAIVVAIIVVAVLMSRRRPSPPPPVTRRSAGPRSAGQARTAGSAVVPPPTLATEDNATVWALVIPELASEAARYIQVPRWCVDDEVDDDAYKVFRRQLQEAIGVEMIDNLRLRRLDMDGYVDDNGISNRPVNARAEALISQGSDLMGLPMRQSPVCGTTVFVGEGNEGRDVETVPQWARAYVESRHWTR